LNRDFAWRRSPSKLRALTPAQAAEFDERGFLLYAGAFSADDVLRAQAEIEPAERKVEEFLRGQKDGKLFIAKADAITFTTHLVTRSRFLREFSAARPILDLCHDLIGPDVRLYWDQAVYKKPHNTEEFPWHQDNGYTFIEPQQYLTCWVALTDTDEENGCPWVMPGLHKQGTLLHEMTDLGWQCAVERSKAVPVPAKAGDIVVFSSLTPHRTGPNLTDGVRKSYILQYAPEGARTIGTPGKPGGLQADPARQYPVLVRGAAVAVP
jgi:ectoine hydroxylase-related dioxygenase (phytanoyl-CoA dioxygenase family)